MVGEGYTFSDTAAELKVNIIVGASKADFDPTVDLYNYILTHYLIMYATCTLIFVARGPCSWNVKLWRNLWLFKVGCTFKRVGYHIEGERICHFIESRSVTNQNYLAQYIIYVDTLCTRIFPILCQTNIILVF